MGCKPEEPQESNRRYFFFPLEWVRSDPLWPREMEAERLEMVDKERSIERTGPKRR